MFNREKNEKTGKGRTSDANLNAAVTILTNGCQFTGKMYCRGSSRIGGKIEGQIISEGLLIVEEEAMISADIQAEDAIIQGKVKGKLAAKGRVELCSSGKFEGDIQTPVLIIREGAQFNGRSIMSLESEEEKKKSSTKENTSKVGALGDTKANRKVPVITETPAIELAEEAKSIN